MRLWTLVFALVAAMAWPDSADAEEFVKLLVRDDRMYSVAIDALAASGVDLAGLPADRISIEHAGKTVPVSIEGAAANGELLPGSRIVFWGEFPRGTATPKNPFTRENAYHLRWDGRDSPRRFAIAQTAAQESAQPPLHTWRRTRRVERDLYLAHYQYYEGAPTDRVMWTKLMAPPRENPKNRVRFDLADLDTGATGEASLSALLWGTSSLGESPDHRWQAVLNGTTIGTAEWDGNTSCAFKSEAFPESLLREKDNELAFVSLLSGKTVDAALLDWVDLSYTARYVSGTEELEFTAPEQSGARIAFDVAGNHPRIYSRDGFILDPEVDEAGKFGAQLPPQFSGATLRIGSTETMAAPERIMPRRTNPLPTSADRLDYVVIAHAAFMDALAPLIQRRQEQGLRTALVDIEDLYDAFTDGMFSADAIRLFLDGLLRESPSPSPLKYVFLVGDASYDYFAIRAKDANFVPTIHTTLDENGDLPDYAPTLALDDAFVYPSAGARIPRAAVGRLPAHSVETVEAYVRKVMDYESRCESQRQEALFIAARGFESFVDRLARSPQAGVFDSAFIRGRGNDSEDQSIPGEVAEAFESGLDILYFVGHGAQFMWRTGPDAAKHTSDVFTSKQVAELRNAGRYPLVFAATCFSTLFDAPLHNKSYSDSGVGVHLVEAPEAGAIAVIGQVSKITAGEADVFTRDMLDHMRNPEVERLGDAFLHAKQHSSLLLDPYLRGIALIGDPALRVGERFHQEGT